MKITPETIRMYRTCFSTNAGRVVLGHLLMEGGYFDADLKTEGEIAVQNFVKQIMQNLGVYGDTKEVSEYINKLFEIPEGKENT